MPGTGLMESKILLGADGSGADHWWLYPSDVAGILRGSRFPLLTTSRESPDAAYDLISLLKASSDWRDWRVNSGE